MTHRTPSSIARLAAVTIAVVLATAVSGCGSDDSKSGDQSSASTSPSVAPYLPVPGDVDLTPPGTALKIGQHAVVAWHPRQDTVATLDVQVTRVERTTFDKSFQGWKITASQAAMTPYFARVVATNESDTALDPVPVPLWGQDDAQRLVQTQPFDARAFQPCHPAKLPTTLKPGARVDLCFVFLMSPGHDLASVAFQPLDADGHQLQPITWQGKIQTKVKPPAEPKKKSSKSSKKSSKQKKGAGSKPSAKASQ